MRCLHRLVARVAAAATLATLALLAQTTSAHAETPAGATATTVPVAAPVRVALTTTSATPMGSLMLVLDVLGIMEKDAPKPPAATTRTATFLSPEPPKTPLFYSSLVVAKF